MEQVNKLVTEQQKLVDDLSRKLSNIKKDSKARKTEKYLEEKTVDVDGIWQKITAKNSEILETDTRKEHNYFKVDYFGQAESVYQKLCMHIEECRNALMDDKAKCRENHQRATKLVDQARRIELLNLDIESAKIATDGFLQYLDDIKGQWQKIVDNDVELSRSPPEQRNCKYFQEDWFSKIRTLYREITVHLEKSIREQKTNGTTASNFNASSNTLLPKIKIPLFDGKYEEWPTFQDIFKKVIHQKTNISKVEKLQYLKTYVKGEANKAIQHYEITENNYDSAWKELEERFDNKRRIVNKLINKILQLPSIQRESAEQLKTMYNTVKECVEAIKMQKINTENWDPIIVCVMTNKWDSRTNELYETSLESTFEMQSLESVLKFLLKRFQSMEATEPTTMRSGQGLPGKYGEKQHSDKINCKYCNSSHSIYVCPEFKALNSSDRFNVIRGKKLCYNCLNHDFSRKCLSQTKCKICDKNHHTLIHRDEIKSNNFKSNKNTNFARENVKNEKSVKVSSNLTLQGETVLLATAMIKVKNASNGYEFLRALIDPGSQAAFVTEETASLLGLPRENIRAEITGIGDAKPRVSNKMIKVDCKSRFSSTFRLNTELLILPKITKDTPEREVYNETADWVNYVLADPTFYKPGPIDIMLGAREYKDIITNGIVKTNNGLLGQNTEFGYIIFGAGTNSGKKTIEITSMMTRTTKEENDISKFWELEEVTSENAMTKEDDECEKFYDATTKRHDDGTYTVQIPFKNDNTELGESRPRAMARFLQLEKRLEKENKHGSDYKEFMQEYIDLGHMTEIPKQEEKNGNYYIPHQFVIREESTTTKLRVVFDASCKTTNGKSLNEVMHVGPRIQQELCDILIRWRNNRIAFTADIEKMYRQIKMGEADQEFQRILWRFSKNDPVKEYKLTTVTYGTAAAPYLAVRTIQKLAEDERDNYPKAVNVAKNDCYVDDVLNGADTDEDAIQVQKELINMFKSGGFNLRKWCSNSKKLVEHLPEELKEKQWVEFSDDELKKSLGIFWAPREDIIKFRVNLADVNTNTKRAILSNVSKVFDPLGLLAPIIITAKLIIQEIWKCQAGWDEPIPRSIEEKWTKFHNQLGEIEKIVIPRWTQYSQNKTKIEIHGFCDASEKAIGAVVYLKTQGENKQTEVALISAKSKVAPIKTKTTLPRLELCAAVLLAKLLHRIITAMSLTKHEKIYAWSDSMIALSWIKGDASRWKTFVANRVSEINQLGKNTQWRHVGTKDNPADSISRGMEPSKLKQNTLWWEGPTWLKEEESKWPSTEEIKVIPLEEKRCLQIKVNTPNPEKIYAKFSDLTKATRVMAYCLRFVNNCKKANSKSKGALSVKELNEAINKMIIMDQMDHFKDELKNIKKENHVPKDSKIASLHPFIDGNKILRVGGRLQKSMLNYNEKYPIILAKGLLSEMIVRDAHNKTLHGGNQQTLAFTRRRYWIINGKKMVRKEINKCITCTRYKAKTAEQLMGQLPAARVTPAPPFSRAGVDYAGPIQIRTTKGRGNKSYKGYMAIFVCLVTKAIHLELVSDMTSETFLAAFKRFIARRGACTDIYSDNGTTFVGASKLIEQEVIEMLEDSNIKENLANMGIQWHFIPSSAPHFGGIWEAGVKSTKHHLKRVIGQTTLTYEELTTLLCQIEACLNSRPLCTMTDDASDYSALTPGHFLIGRELITPTSYNITDCDVTLTGRWKMIQKMKKDFWKKWREEYLHQLQQRNKWKLEAENLKVGDVVLIKDDNISASQWPLARVKETFEDPQGLVRVVQLKTTKGSDLKRPIHKLIPLPTESDTEEKQDKTKNKTNAKRHSAKSAWKIALLAICFMISLKKAAGMDTRNFHIEYPKPGIYLEHLGTARIDRGLFRIDIKVPNDKVDADINLVNKTINKMWKFCEDIHGFSNEIECKSLIDHLKQEEKRLLWIKKGIDQVTLKRSKRGIFGEVLTSIFGVNEEVYREIDDLDQNQKKLIQTSSHQTRIMVKALARFNDTEMRIQEKMRRFQEKINKGLGSIEEMNVWYKTTDRNRLEIHLLSVYEVAKNILDELIKFYESVLNISVTKSNIYELISPAHVEQLIADCSLKIPQNIEIMAHPIIRADVVKEKNITFIYGYLAIAEITEYTLIKPNAIPIRIKNNSYWMLDVGKNIIAIDYNNQHYFEITDAEIKTCTELGRNLYLSTPSIIRQIDNNPNCVIDEIFNRTEETTCVIRENKISHVMIWKKLYTSNSWLFISRKKTKLAITCNGEREEIKVNQTGIIAISQSCVISTRNFILTPKRLQTVPVLAGYMRPIGVNLTTSKIKVAHSERQEDIELNSIDDFKDLTSDEENLQLELDNTTWNKVYHHSTLTSVITTISMIVIFMASIFGVKIIIQKVKGRKKPQKTETPDEPTYATMEMRPLQKPDTNDPLRNYEFPNMHESENE